MLQALGEIAFRTAKGRQTQAQRRLTDRITLAYTRQDLLLNHHFKFRRHARRKEHQAAVKLNGKAAGGTDRIVDKLGAGRDLRLLAVARRHHAATLAEETLHKRQPLFVHNQRFTFRRCRSKRAKVIAGRPEAAVHNQNICLSTALAQNSDQVIQVIPNGVTSRQRNTLLETKISKPGSVCIDDLPR